MGLVLLLMHQNMVYDGIKSPSFAPSRVGKDEILYKTSLSSSYVSNVTEKILMAHFKYCRFESLIPVVAYDATVMTPVPCFSRNFKRSDFAPAL